MSKVGIVVQRCHESVVGGAESLAWQYANLLQSEYEVEVLTTTAVDAAYWASVLPEGVEVRDDIAIRRFHVDIGYTPYRSTLFSYLISDFEKYRLGRKPHSGQFTHYPWSTSLQEELIRHIGPYSHSLLNFIRENYTDYRALIFVTYLYPTSYFGLLQVPARYALFVPTLHDEQPAYLSAYKHAARRAGRMIWLSEGERRLGTDLWGEMPSSVVGAHIDATPRTPKQTSRPYVLYCGRIDPNKGCTELFDYFLRFKEAHPSNLSLVLTGQNDTPIPDHADIDFRGFVAAEEKFELMAGASVYMMPSGKESFSIVTLEAMAQKVPVLASGACEVIADHIEESKGGRIYRDYSSFERALNELMNNPTLRKELGGFGRDYVLANFTPERVKRDLVAAIESCAQAFHGEQSPAVSIPASPAPVFTHYVEPKANDLSYTPPMPLPAGWTKETLRELVVSIQVEDGPVAEIKSYANEDCNRFLYTLALVPDEPNQRILELGANPYFTSVLLHKFRDAELHLANFFGEVDPNGGKQNVTIHQTGEVVQFEYEHFNVERDSFPYADDSFDVVLFCEILEHLLSDPVQALIEIKRVLKPGGTLIITTPNVVRLENVRKMIAGQNIYDPYSGYGPYGRHNREYTQQDLFSLLSANGFRPNSLFTADVNDRGTNFNTAQESISGLRNRRPELGQYIFCRAVLNSGAKQVPAARPEWLYRSMQASE